MLNPEDKCSVINRSPGMVRYRIPEKNIIRTFTPGEVKTVPYQEIIDVSQQPGGRKLIYDYLLIKDLGAVGEALNMDMSKEIEYSMTEEQVKGWMHTSTLDQFKDALDFAPDGVKDCIKKYAVELPLNDVAKRQALLEQLGFDVNAAITIKKEAETAEETNEDKKKKEAEHSARRAVETANTTIRQRRARTAES